MRWASWPKILWIWATWRLSGRLNLQVTELNQSLLKRRSSALGYIEPLFSHPTLSSLSLLMSRCLISSVLILVLVHVLVSILVSFEDTNDPWQQQWWWILDILRLLLVLLVLVIVGVIGVIVVVGLLVFTLLVPTIPGISIVLCVCYLSCDEGCEW